MVSLHAALVAMTLSGVGQTVLLDFYADWCAPCRAMNPTVEALIAAGYPVQRVNIDQNRPLAAQYGIHTIPCFVMLVDGREVDRVTEGTTYSRLEHMCKLGVSAAPPTAAPAVAANPAIANPSPWPPTAALNAPPANVLADNNAAVDGNRQQAISDATMLAASVRIRVEDRDGQSCGSGTIIDSRGDEALVLTCGHIFRDSQGKGRITVDLFNSGVPEQVVGQLWSYNLTRDVALVIIRPTKPVVAIHPAPLGYRLATDMAVASVGCNNGDAPTVQHSRITALDKFLGPPTIKVAGQPPEGRSGGGLFSADGYVIGVCNAADPADKEGVFAALGSIQAELDQNPQLASVYQTPSANPATNVAAAGTSPTAPPPTAPPSPAVAAVPPAPLGPMPDATSLAAFERPPAPDVIAASATSPATGASATASSAVLSPQDQAALDEIRRLRREGAEVICIVRPRGNPNAASQVIMLNQVSPEFLRQLAAEVQPSGAVGQPHELARAAAEGRPGDEYPTSFRELPRRVLLEWSAPTGH